MNGLILGQCFSAACVLYRQTLERFQRLLRLISSVLPANQTLPHFLIMQERALPPHQHHGGTPSKAVQQRGTKHNVTFCQHMDGEGTGEGWWQGFAALSPE